MADLTNELDDILNSFSEADRPAMREMLTRNPAATSTLTSRETVYKAFVDGDPAKIQQAQAEAAAAAARAAASATGTNSPATNPNPPASPTSAVSLGLDQINALLNERVKSFTTSPEFQSAVDARAKEIADQQLKAERANIIGAGAEISDTISSIRESHLREFNEPLDSVKFREYYAAEGPKHGNRLQETYDAFVNEKRIEKRIADGVKAGLEAQATAAVPGSAVPGVGNPMAPNFVDFNVRKIDPNATVTPSADADKAVQAFAQMRGGWTQ
jgi:hypothetical protein